MLSVQFTQGSKIRDTSSRVKQLPAANTFSVVIAPMMIWVPREGSGRIRCASLIEHTALCASVRDAYTVHGSSGGLVKHPGKYLWAQPLQLPSWRTEHRHRAQCQEVKDILLLCRSVWSYTVYVHGGNSWSKLASWFPKGKDWFCNDLFFPYLFYLNWLSLSIVWSASDSTSKS